MMNLQRLGLTGICGVALSIFSTICSVIAQPINANSPVTNAQSAAVEKLARLTTVRILTPNASGSGTIVRQQDQVYTVVTNWHVVTFSKQHTAIAPDGQRYRPLGVPKQLGNADLAIVQFRSSTTYQVAKISTDLLTVGEPVFAAGFPMYRAGSLTTTFDRGIQAFRLTQGIVSVLPPKSLAQGYRLGYTNDVAIGMSGGPIFNSQGLLVGINGRMKNRDPDFGVYTFEDGTEPSKAMLELMVNSSWGIPISTYLRYAPVSLQEQSIIESPAKQIRCEHPHRF
jgi:serine protease Do